MAFIDEFSLTDRIAAHMARIDQEEKDKLKAELDFASTANETEKELHRTQGYFVIAVVALFVSLVGNFLQMIGGFHL
ncbi:hypothetical protein V2P20_09220 [Methylobacter sp. Wu1]|uniref:hypothetical protein n=1 Tax=Methylobacter sp. Wu1 TaxID=3119359 RepID=UPI002F92825B